MDPMTREAHAFDVVTLLPGICQLTKRSGDLEGALPARAARYCGPVFEGSAAGYQIRLVERISFTRKARGEIEFGLSAPFADLSQQAGPALERAIAEGLLERKSHWHRMFRDDVVAVRGQRLLLWTGHFVRPRASTWLLVGGAFNRRSRIAVIDHLVTDPHRFVPLILEFDLGAVTRRLVPLEWEIGCVTPVAPAARMTVEPLTAGAEELRRFVDFYSEEHLKAKLKKPTGRYLQWQRDHRIKPADRCEARLLHVGPNVHRVKEFQRFITMRGFSRSAATPGTLQYAMVHNTANVRWTFQGQTTTTMKVDHGRYKRALERLWTEAFGETNQLALEFWLHYIGHSNWDEPLMVHAPLLLLTTSPGWSTLTDGVHAAPQYDGMRGLIDTDWYPALGMVYRLYGPGSVHLHYRAPLLRAIPVPRAILELPINETSLN
jgi:hypothetical protein